MNAPVRIELGEMIERTRKAPSGEQVRAEHARRKSNRETIFDVLRDGAWHTNSELFASGGGFRYGARICELRQLGHVIHAQDIARGMWKWRLDPSRTVDADCIFACCIGRAPGDKVPGEVRP